MPDALDDYLSAKPPAAPAGDALDALDGLTPEKKAKLQAGIERQGAKVAALNAEPDPMSLGEIAKNVPGTMEALADRFNNGITVGGWGALRRLIDPAGAAVDEARRHKILDSGPGQVVGGVMAGAGGGIVAAPLGAGVQAAVSSKLPGLAASAGGRIVANAAGGGAVGGLTEAAQAANEGEDLKGTARRALRGTGVGALLGGGLSAVGEGAAGVSQAIRRNPQVGRFAAARDAGRYRDPEMASLPKGRQGMQEASDSTVEKMATRENQLAEQAGKEWNLATASPDVMKKPVDTELVRGALHAGRLKHIDPDSGMPTNDSIVAAYDKALKRTPTNATVEGLLKRRQALKEAAAFDNPNPSPEQLAARDVYHTFRLAIRDASPELAAADDAYSASTKAADRRAELVGTDLRKATPAQRETAAARIGRVDDENVPGMRARQRLDELRASDPEIGKAMDFLADKKAMEAVRFGAPHMPTHFSGATLLSGIPRLVMQNARALGAQAIDPMALAISRNVSPGTLNAGNAALPALLQGMDPVSAAIARLRAQQQQDQQP